MIFIALLCIISGFIIGLGAVTVIDVHGFLGRKSSYWTEATTRTHKITKPLIWIGTILFILGFSLLYSGFALILQSLIAFVMIVNGLFLSFSVSPFLLKREKEGLAGELLPKKWQRKIILSFIISFLSWWFSVLFFVYLMASFFTFNFS